VCLPRYSILFGHLISADNMGNNGNFSNRDWRRNNFLFFALTLLMGIAEAANAAPLSPQQEVVQANPDILENKMPESVLQYHAVVVSDDILRQATRETKPVTLAPNALPNQSIDRFGSGKNEEILARAFQEAKVPDCLHQDAMQFAPPKIGAVSFTGAFALPWWGYAIMSGHCN